LRLGTPIEAVVKFSRNGVPQRVYGVPPPEIAVPHPKVIIPPRGSFRHQFGKIIKIFATILRLKCTKYYFGWGSAQDPAGGDYSARPDPLAGRRPTSKGMGGAREKQGRELRKARDGKKIARNVAFHHLLSNLTTE